MNIQYLQNIRIIQWLGFAIISLFILDVYSPSLLDGPRSDQLGYLAELEFDHKTSLWDLTIGSMDLNRHLHLYPGDEILFRPALYVVLGTEVYFFGLHYFFWQALGILLHLAVIWTLLRLLLTIYAGWEAVCFSAFFAFLFVNIEMVIWQHINSYLIFLICVLVALRHFYILITQKNNKINQYIIMSLWLLLGAFTHEIVNGIALIMGLFLWKTKPNERLWALSILAVPIVYLTANITNFYLHPCSIIFSARGGIGRILSDWFLILGHWLYTGFFPFEFQWLDGPRSVIAPNELSLIKPLHLWSIATISALGIISTYSFILLKSKRRFSSGEGIVSILALIFIGMLVTMIDLGRGGQHPIIEVLRINTYYLYIFWVLTTICLYALIDWKSASLRSKYLLCFFVGIFILINASRLYAFNDQIASNQFHKNMKLLHQLKSKTGLPPTTVSN